MSVNSSATQKRKRPDPMVVAGKKFKSKKKARRAAAYHSSDEDEENENKLDTATAKRLKIQEEAVRKQNNRARTGPAGAANVDDETLVDGDQAEDVAGDVPSTKDEDGGVQIRTSDLSHRDRESGIGQAQHNSKIPPVEDDGEEPSSTETSSSASDSEGELDGNDTDDILTPKEPLQKSRSKTKRNDPTSLATSLNAILTSKPSAKVKDRTDPILSRSKSAADLSHAREEAKLEARVKRKLKQDRRERLERGHVPDVITGGPSASQAQRAVDVGLTATARGQNSESKVGKKEEMDEQAGLGNESRGADTAAVVAEREKRLRKTAQRGVVKLFNAVRAAQVAGLAAESEAKKKGVVGMEKRKDRVNEMSKEGFLGMLNGKVTDG